MIWQLVVAGIVVHIILFYSIFDIYFTSPLVHGMTATSVPGSAPASRLVLFVADGLRADKFFEPDENGRSRAPYLRSVMEEKGAWGVSHTRVPTESRPGHVALIAGFYEDVSAVAKGWKENPVDFDSVFNQSRQTWSWGSPDILPMFAKGAIKGHVHTNCYPADLEDFAGSDMTKLDTWVFDKVHDFFMAASKNATLNSALHENKLVLFLHLLGIDTHGHSNKPHSREYLNNIRMVDRGIRDTVNLIEDFFKRDGQTVFVMTADHGMTDWGSHGAGHPQETLTPFLAWGPGIRGPVLADRCGSYPDQFCSDWRLDFLKRSDMEQADIAPLMAYLIGIPLPVNSVGVLPTDVVEASPSVKAAALLTNARQILAQFEVKRMQVKDRTISATFRPFLELEDEKKDRALRHIQHLIDSGRAEDAIRELRTLIQQGLKGLRYYQTYDRLFLGMSIALGFLGWICYIIHLLLSRNTLIGQHACNTKSNKSQDPARTEFTTGTVIFSAVAILIIILLYVQSLPTMYYVYCLLPAFLWYKAIQGWSTLLSAYKTLGANLVFPWKLALACVGCLIGLELMVHSFYVRELLSLCLVVLSTWPLVSSARLNQRSNRATLTFAPWLWGVSCLLVACFPLLPVVGRNTQYELVIMSGLTACIIGGAILMCWSNFSSSLSKRVLVFQVFLVAVSVVDVAVTSWSVQSKKGLPWLCQLTSWVILGTCMMLPLLTGTGLVERLLSLTLAFIPIYLLLSITYEGFFLLSLLLLLSSWLLMEEYHKTISIGGKHSLAGIDFEHSVNSIEHKDHKRNGNMLQVSDLRRAFFFVFFIIVAFFGTGNIASINSFDPSSVYCFLTVFNPFIMGSLMMLKNLLPFLVVTCALQGVQVVTQTPLQVLFLLVLVMSDIMGLHFFFLVQDHGSWLEIGTTISHYVIVMAMIIFLLMLTGVSRVLTTWRLPVAGRAKH